MQEDQDVSMCISVYEPKHLAKKFRGLGFDDMLYQGLIDIDNHYKEPPEHAIRLNQLISTIPDCTGIPEDEKQQYIQQEHRRILSDAFEENMMLNFNLVKSLNRLDYIGGKCFDNVNDITDAFIDLLEDMEVTFILNQKHYNTPNRLWLSVVVFYDGYMDEIINDLK